MQDLSDGATVRPADGASPAVRSMPPHDNADGACFASLLGLVLAGFAVASRAGFDDLLWQTAFRSLGLCWLLLHFGWFVRSVAGRTRSSGATALKTLEPWWLSNGALTLFCLTILLALGQMAGHFEWTFLAWSAYAGFLLAGARALAALPQLAGNLWRMFGLACLAIFLGLFFAGAIWGSGYQNPLFVENLTQGNANIDTLFHAAVSNMIRTHGVPSTGLDGVPFMPYHFGSHWLFAQICNLIDVSVIDFYNVGYPIVFAPFGVYCLMIFAREVASRSNEDANSGGSVSMPARPAFWLVLCLGYVGLLPLDAGYETAISRTSILVSESYGVAVAVAFLGLSIVVRLFREMQRSPNGNRASRYFAAAVVLPLTLAAVALCKISIFLLLAVAGMYGFARLKLYRSPVFVVLLISSCLFGGVAFRVSYAPGYEAETGWVPFGYLRANVQPQWWGLFWLCYFVWVWVLIALHCRKRNINTLAEFVAALRRGDLLDVELTVLIAAAGAAPGVLLSQWSSMHYFSEYQHWIALALVLGMLARRVEVPDDVSRAAKKKISSLSMRQLAVWGLGTILAVTAILNIGTLLRQGVSINLASRGFPEGGTGIGVKLEAGDFRGAWKQLCEISSQPRQPQARLVVELRRLDRLPLGTKREAVLFVPRVNLAYWELLSTPYSPRDVPLVGPALTGLAMVDGLYDPHMDDRWTGYGYQQYSQPSIYHPPTHFETGDPELCRRARELGFRQIFRLAIDKERGNVSADSTPVDCP